MPRGTVLARSSIPCSTSQVCAVHGPLDSPHAERPAWAEVLAPPGDVLPSSKRASGNVLLLSFAAGDERLLLRMLSALNAEAERTELGYEAQARLYFYLGFQRYAMLRWLILLCLQEDKRSREQSDTLNIILRRLMSPEILDHETIDEQMYRNMIIALSGEMFALLRLARAQIGGRGSGASAAEVAEEASLEGRCHGAFGMKML